MDKSKIMVVDDDPAIGDFLTRFLTKKNYEVTSFTSGKKALEYLENNLVNLIITDMHMPEMNGVELTKSAKKVKPNLPIVVMSATADMKAIAEITKLGIADYFTKPFTLDYLAGQIARILALHQSSKGGSAAGGNGTGLAKNNS